MNLKDCKPGDIIQYSGRSGKVLSVKISLHGRLLALVETDHPNFPRETLDLETGTVRAQYGQGISLATWERRVQKVK